MVCYFVQGELLWIEDLQPTDPFFFYKIGQIKKNLSAKKLCTGKALGLQPFAEEILKY